MASTTKSIPLRSLFLGAGIYPPDTVLTWGGGFSRDLYAWVGVLNAVPTRINFPAPVTALYAASERASHIRGIRDLRPTASVKRAEAADVAASLSRKSAATGDK